MTTADLAVETLRVQVHADAINVDMDIGTKYAALGGPAGILGEATGAETPGPGGGAFQEFTGGAIYWAPGVGAYALYGPVLDKYRVLGGPAGFLGYPTSDVTVIGQGACALFVGGAIFWKDRPGLPDPDTGQAPPAYEVHGEILVKYTQLGGHLGPLGYPWSDEEDAQLPGGRVSYFEQGAILFSGQTGAKAVQGAIYKLFLSMQHALGFPTTDETATPDAVGRFNHFQGGSIYWTPSTGAKAVQGAIQDKWASLGWEAGVLGYPTTSETATPDTVGRFNHFQGGSIYWTPATGAHSVQGAIRDKWASLGWERGDLGYPTTDETATPDTVGRFNHFQGGSIYWTPATGAHSVLGAIRDKWAAMGWEQGALGYPVGDTVTVTDSIKYVEGGVPRAILPVVTAGNEKYCEFQHGFISWNPVTGASACLSGTRYVLSLESFRITMTRSLDDDTDVVSVALALDGGAPVPLSKDMGDVDNGVHELNLAFGPALLDKPESRACLTYLIVNSGFDDDAAKIAKTVNVNISNVMQNIPVVGSWAKLVEGVIDLLIDLFTVDCDGVVAADKFTLAGWMLNDFTAATGEFRPGEMFYPGTDSDTFCGDNSEYYVTWTVARVEPPHG